MEFHPTTAADSHTTPTTTAFKPTAEGKPWYFDHPYRRSAPSTPANPQYLTPQQISSFHTDGILILPAAQAWTPQELQAIVQGTDKMDDWPDTPGKWMKYYEKAKANVEQQEEKRADNNTTEVNHNNYVASANDAKMLQRIENFCQYNQQLDDILRGSKMLGMCTELLGEPSVLYKEKVNYKMPGAEGFAPHQDVCAGWWMYNQDLHISVLICIDPATLENGCLEVVRGKHTQGMLSEEYKEVNPQFVKDAKWEYCPTQTGDVIFFDSYVPHRSGPNLTKGKRRVLYSTYAKASQGDLRDKYYADKRVSFPPDCERLEGKKYEYKI